MGEGKPLVLLHGLLGSSDNWLTIGKHFSDRYEVFIPDMRNHGHSPHDEIMNYKALSEDLHSFFEANNISSAILLGHSMGGKAAMQFALDYSVRVAKLIVADIGIKKYPINHVRFLQILKNIDFNLIATRKDIEKLLSEQIHSNRLVQHIMKNIEWKKDYRLGWRSNIDGLLANINNILDAVYSENIFTKPTLFIRGALSDYIIDEDINDIKNKFSLMALVTVPDAGHWLQVDNRSYFIDAVEKFIKE